MNRNRKSLFIGIVVALIGVFLSVASPWLLPYYSLQIGLFIIVVGVLVISLGRRHPSTQPIPGKGSTVSNKAQRKNVSTIVLSYIAAITLSNALGIYFVIQTDRELFEDLTRFGLSGSWNLLTLDLHDTVINQTFSYANGTILMFLLVVIGNILFFILIPLHGTP